MCLICVELKKGALTPIEARKNFGEMREVIDDDHKLEVLKQIWEKEDEDFESILDYGSD
jgi:hypothetical protein